MPSGCRFPEHHQSSGGGVLPVVAAVVIGAALLSWIIHILLLIATVIGGVVMVGGAGFVWLKVHQFRAGRMLPPGQSVMRRSQVPPAAFPGELAPRGDVHTHLHLPPGMTAEELRAVMRGTDRDRW